MPPEYKRFIKRHEPATEKQLAALLRLTGIDHKGISKAHAGRKLARLNEQKEAIKHFLQHVLEQW